MIWDWLSVSGSSRKWSTRIATFTVHTQVEHGDPGKDHSEGRNQRVLDFANPAVVDHMIEQMKQVIGSANIAYVKWDMNRIISDYYSQYLPKDRQQEVAHRYIQGVYRLAKELTQAFPEVLFEGCAAGGNRFDLGMLCYFPRIGRVTIRMPYAV